MRQTRKITLLKKKVANKKKRNTYKRIKIKKAFRNKKKGGFIKCGLSSTLGRKSVKVLSKELYEIGDIDDKYIVDKREHAIEVLKKLKDHYKQNSRTLSCECSLIKEGDPNNDEKFSTKNECENAKVEYYRNLKSAFTKARLFVILKYYNPEAIGMKDQKSLEKEKDNLQTIIDEINNKITGHDKKIEERIHKDLIPPPTGSNLSKLAELQEKLAARTEKNRENKKNMEYVRWKAELEEAARLGRMRKARGEKKGQGTRDPKRYWFGGRKTAKRGKKTKRRKTAKRGKKTKRGKKSKRCRRLHLVPHFANSLP